MTTKAPSTSGGRSPAEEQTPRIRDKKREHRPSSGGGGDGGDGGRRQRHRASSEGGSGAADPPCANAHALRTLDARFSLHLHPSRAGDALAGAREALAAQLLRHSADLGGVLLAVANERLVPAEEEEEDATGNPPPPPSSAAPPPAPLHPYHPYLRVTAAARALLFRLPPRGHPLVGFVTKVGRDYVALLVLGCLGAALGSSGIRSDFKFRPGNAVVVAGGGGAGGAASPAGDEKDGEQKEKEGEEKEKEEGEGKEEQGGSAAAATAIATTPAAWVSRRDPTHVLTVGTEVRFEVTGSVSAGGLYSILGALRQPWTGAMSHVAGVAVSSAAAGGRSGKGGGGRESDSDDDEEDKRKDRKERSGGKERMESGKDKERKERKEGKESKEKKRK